MSDFDEELESQEVTEALVASIKPFIKERCCVFVESDSGSEVIHGRFMAFIKQWPALMIRDLTPGHEKLNRKRIVNLDLAGTMCLVPSQEQCKQCDVYKDLVALYKAEKEKEKEEKDGTDSSDT